MSTSLHGVREFLPMVKITFEQEGISKYYTKTFNQLKEQKLYSESKIKNNRIINIRRLIWIIYNDLRIDKKLF